MLSQGVEFISLVQVYDHGTMYKAEMTESHLLNICALQTLNQDRLGHTSEDALLPNSQPFFWKSSRKELASQHNQNISQVKTNMLCSGSGCTVTFCRSFRLAEKVSLSRPFKEGEQGR